MLTSEANAKTDSGGRARGALELSFLLIRLGLFCGFNRIRETFTLRL